MSTKTKTQKISFSIGDEKGKNNSDCVYFFRMDGCGHCEHLKPIWNEVVKTIKESHPSVKFVEVESAEISKLDGYTKSKLKTDQIMGYPDLRILKKNGDTSTFQSNRTVDDLVKWIKTNITENKSAPFKRVPTPFPGKTKRRRGGNSCSSLKGGRGRRSKSRSRRRIKRRTLRK